MRRLAMRFNGILRGRKADPLPAWIDDAIETDLGVQSWQLMGWIECESFWL